MRNEKLEIMDLQEYLDKAIKNARSERLANSDQLTLGALISKINSIENIEATVRYDFGYLFPDDIDSWRGAYEELALNYKDEGEEMMVGEFLKMLKGCIGETYSGYKGGEYVMDENTPIWVANCGSSGSTAVVDVINNGYVVILVTAYREY